MTYKEYLIELGYHYKDMTDEEKQQYIKELSKAARLTCEGDS